MVHTRKIEICTEDMLGEKEFLTIPVIYRNKAESSIVFRLDGQVLAYLNRCVHMPRRLDCERKTIFDESGRHLRCSMHGIVYNPFTGESISTMCHGERLTRIKILRENDKIYFVDKRVRPIPQ